MEHKIAIREAITQTDTALFWEELHAYHKRDIFPDPEEQRVQLPRRIEGERGGGAHQGAPEGGRLSRSRASCRGLRRSRRTRRAGLRQA